MSATEKSLKDIVEELADTPVADKQLVATNEFSIEHNVPIPKTTVNRTRIYPFAKMEAGDSFKVAVPEGTSIAKVAARVRAAVTAWRSQGHKDEKYIVRAVDGAVRCWKTE